MNLQELEKKYEELGKEIEYLKKQELKAHDCVYLLSVEEYEKYREIIPKFNYWWWLRTPGIDKYRATYVDVDGSIENYGDGVSLCGVSIRPVLNISNIELYKLNHTFVDHDTLIHCGITWKRIDTDLFIAEIPIAIHRFDARSNDYKNSEVRRFLLEWYGERKNW